MNDYGEIVSMLTRIQHAVDHQNLEAFKDCWCEDTQLHLTLADGSTSTIPSRADLIARFASGWAGQPSAMRHLVQSVEVNFTGPTTATADFYCSYVNVGDAATFLGVGEYSDELVKAADGKWRVKVRRHRFLTPLALRG